MEKNQIILDFGSITNNGNYFCIFCGQSPAWPVEYIGQVKGESWKKLIENSFDLVTIRPKFCF